MALQNAFGSLALEATLQSILTELNAKLEAGQSVELGATTLAALESITATLSGTPTVALDAGSLAALETITAVISGAVALDAGTLAALETIDLGATTLSALESITVVDGGGSLTVDDGAGSLTVDGTIELGSTTLAAMKEKSLEENTLSVTNTAATGVACTLTLPAPGASLFQYITNIDIELYATAARTGGATPVIVTSTNIPGTPSWNFPTAQAIGTIDRQKIQLERPLKASAANTAVTIVAPIATTGLWRITAYYYTGA